jgi:membrane associated rhomboid family serine protease
MLALPYSVDRKLTGTPHVVYGLAAVNACVYLACLLMGAEVYKKLVFSVGLIPADLKWYSLFTMHFIHDAPSPAHVGFNLLFLVLFARHVEDTIGHVWFLLIYVCGGVAAAMLHVVATALVDPGSADVPMIGASGAIAAALGVFAVRFYRTRVRVFWIIGIGLFLNRAGVWKASSFIVLGLWGLWELVQGVWQIGGAGVQEAGGVAHWAHLGGLGFGAVIALASGLHRQAQEMYTKRDAYDFFRRGDLSKASHSFTQLLREEPNSADMHFKLGVALDCRNHRVRAVSHFRQAIELYVSQNDIAEATRIYQRVSDDPGAARHLEPQTLLKMADYLAQEKRFGAACQAFGALANSQPGLPEAERGALRCGDILLNELGQPGRALQWYELVRDRGKIPENVSEAERSATLAQQALGARQQPPD